MSHLDMRNCLSVCALLLLLLIPCISFGEKIGNAPFGDRVAIMGKILPLYSGGIYKEGHNKIYAAALYLPDGFKTEDYVKDIHKCLEFYFFAMRGPNELSSPPLLSLKNNLPPEKFEKLQDRLDRITSAYHEVYSGERCALAYLPGKGTELSCNGKALVTVEGADFAEAYFGVWLGNPPINNRLKGQLMEKRFKNPTH